MSRSERGPRRRGLSATPTARRLAAAAALLAAHACVFESPGIEASLAFAPTPALATTLRGDARGWRLAALDLHVSAVELRRCPLRHARSAEPTSAPGAASLTRALHLGALAYAHEPSTPLRASGGAVVDALGDDATAPRELGLLLPPPGSYCSVRVELGPSDGHSVGVLRRAGALLRRSVRVELAHDDAPSEDAAVRVYFDHGRAVLERTLAAPLTLRERDARGTTLTLRLDGEQARRALGRALLDDDGAARDAAAVSTGALVTTLAAALVLELRDGDGASTSPATMP